MTTRWVAATRLSFRGRMKEETGIPSTAKVDVKHRQAGLTSMIAVGVLKVKAKEHVLHLSVKSYYPVS